MSDDIKSGMLSEGDAAVRGTNESLENIPTTRTGEGDASSVRDRADSAPVSSAIPAADADIEHVSRTATSPSVEAEPDDDPQSPGKAV